MKFEVSQPFDADALDVMRCYASPSTYERLPEFGKISRPELLDCTDEADTAGTVRLRLRYRFTADLPAAALAVIDPARLTWVEDTTYDFGSMTATTKLLPDHYPQKLQASASARFTEGSSSKNTSTRRVSGDLRVRVLLVAGQVERAIVSGLTEHLAEEAALVEEILNDR